MTDDMTRLCDEIIAGRGMRADFLAGMKDTVENLREATVEMRADFREAHEDMATDTKVRLENAVEQIKHRVAELKKQSADTRQATRQNLDEMAHDQRVELNAYITDLASAVTTMLDGFSDARGSMAKEIQAELGNFCDGIRSDVAALQAAIRKAQVEAAQGSHKDRLSFLADQAAFVNRLADQVANMMAGFRRDQEKTAGEDRGSRQRFVSELRTEVDGQRARFAQNRRQGAQEIMDRLKSFEEEIKLYVKELKAEVRAMRLESSDDLAGARAAWQGRKASVPLVVRAKQTPEKMSPENPMEQAAEKEPPPAKAMEAEPPRPEPKGKAPIQAEEKRQAGEQPMEQLTMIKGIGPRLQSKLYLAGIYTYAKLAESDPTKLREILGEAARSANVESWIRQAKKLI